MDITPYLKLMIEKSASDMFFSVGAPVNVKVEGLSQPIDDHVLQPGEVKQLAYSIISDDQRKQFEREFELNLAISFGDVGRFRVNVFRQRGEEAMVIRYIKVAVPSIDSLGLPRVLKDLIMEMRGLILVVGATSSGKSTSLASMVDHRNELTRGHILTIEDPIEYLHRHKKSIVDQREVGLDTLSYKNALINAMREAPDVIMIGEIREQETMQHAIAYSETGHLCLSTLHANNANQALDRIINFFPETAHQQILQDLSLNLRAIISQRLIPGKNKKRVAATEVLINTPYVSDLIEKGQIEEIKNVMERSVDSGMQTFDHALFELYQAEQISKENALKYADSRNNLGLKIRLSEDGTLASQGSNGFSISRDEYRDL